MQLFSLADLGTGAQQVLADFEKLPMPKDPNAAWIAGGVLFGLLIITCLIAAHLVAKDKAGFGASLNAAFQLLIALALIGVLAGFSFIIATAKGSEAMTKASLIIGGILLLYAMISTAMRAYKMHFGQALGFVLIAAVVFSAGALIALQFLPDPLSIKARALWLPRLMALSVPERAEIVTRLRQGEPGEIAPEPAATAATATATDAAPATPGTPPPSIEQRHQELTKLYAELQARRAALQPGDEAGLEAYNREDARYRQMLEALQRDVDAAPKN